MKFLLRKVSKQTAEYSRGHAGAHCGKVLDDDKSYCRHFIPPLSPTGSLWQCEKVAGAINHLPNSSGSLAILAASQLFGGA
jgi:hypothetical protein